MQIIKTLSHVGIIIFLYYVVHYAYIGLINPVPAPGDSWDYHIPISKSILDGSFLHPSDYKVVGQYFPGSSEAINSLLIILGIPLTLSNILAVIVLFFVCFKLGLIFRMRYYWSLLFATTICTLNVFVRWYNAVSIDVWLCIFFLLGVILLEHPKKEIKYFVKLGFVLGMLIGTKYTGCIFFLLLLIVYFRSIIRYLNLKNLIAFFIPFSIFGLFWYVRNYIYLQNPFYPLPVLGFKGVNYYQVNVLDETLKQPFQMFDAVFGEYNIWILIIFLTFGFFLYIKFYKKQINIFGINRLYILGFVNLFLYFTFPTSAEPWVMVSSLRYSYQAFIPLILCAFLLASHYKKGYLLGFLAIGSMINVVTMAYHPKLTLIYFPLGLLVIYIFNKYEKVIKL